MLRCTSTLSITTWKNSGETRREQLQEERGDQHLAEQAAVLVDGAAGTR